MSDPDQLTLTARVGEPSDLAQQVRQDDA